MDLNRRFISVDTGRKVEASLGGKKDNYVITYRLHIISERFSVGTPTHKSFRGHISHFLLSPSLQTAAEEDESRLGPHTEESYPHR